MAHKGSLNSKKIFKKNISTLNNEKNIFYMKRVNVNCEFTKFLARNKI